MLNAETPRLKFALYGAHSSLGNALLCELLTRQHEAVALVDDLNSMTVRPGLRAKAGDLFDAVSVSQSVAGMDAVICLYDSPSLATASGAAANHQLHDLYQAVSNGWYWSPICPRRATIRTSPPRCNALLRIR